MSDLYDELNIGRAEYETKQRLMADEDDESGTTKLDLFKDYAKSILESDLQFDTHSGYVPHVINRYLTFDQSMVVFANLMNCNPSLDKEVQFEFLRLSIPKSKRYLRWIRKTGNDDKIKVIMAVYKYSYEKAKAVVGLISDQQFKILERSLDKGGKTNE